MEKKKFLFVIPSLVGGGSERVLVTIANNLCMENEITILTLTKSECFYALNERVKVIKLDNEIKRNNFFIEKACLLKGFFKSLIKIGKTVRKINPNSILSFSNETNLLVILLKTLHLLNCKVIVSERANPYRRKKIFRFFERNFYSNADTVICQSESVCRFFKSKDQEKLKIIRNPLCRAAAAPYFCETRVKKIVSVGRLFPQKNHALLIEAFSMLGPNFDDYTLEIYGEGPLKSKLQQQINESTKKNKIFLMGEKHNVMHSIADASMLVLSSDFEGFPNVIIEALASGLPVVSTDFSPCGVAAEIVNEKNGFVVPCGNPSALAIAIENVLCKKQIIPYMKDESKRIKTIYDEKIVSNEFFEAIS